MSSVSASFQGSSRLPQILSGNEGLDMKWPDSLRAKPPDEANTIS
jgi:hypothetical protein